MLDPIKATVITPGLAAGILTWIERRLLEIAIEAQQTRLHHHGHVAEGEGDVGDGEGPEAASRWRGRIRRGRAAPRPDHRKPNPAGD